MLNEIISNKQVNKKVELSFKYPCNPNKLNDQLKMNND